MNLKKLLFLIFFLNLTVGQAQSSIEKILSKYNSHSTPYISVEELKMLHSDANVVVLDAREEEEFEVSHLKKALFVGYSTFSTKEISHLITNKSALIVVYCSLGIRSETISEKLKNAGYTNIRNLYGGIFEWKNKGYAVFDANGKETEKIHAFSKHWSKYLTNGEKVY
ncbi:rhodanese-like domain-containing protein [Gillisia sp. M10.2A]|uniref:Rhodanese-like domain-containing protein n=1 Tax=Gillisia lutea TaxID=2909668 RepID=A0ABS9ED97_9FLAO|nr:rhodanese-like domain-containing protein [Gillisia lutea]MCF4100840.1 rhodanese-like domain-containing protein [Gillisia lutea]